jgi:hypothetical protein
MLGLPRDAGAAELAEAVAAHADELAGALFAEAADNDDVTGAEAALVYLEDRLVFFGDCIGPEEGAVIRREFARRLSAWG